MAVKRILFVASLLVFTSCFVKILNSQNQSTAATPQVPVFHASSKLVLVDVIVTNNKGEMVPGMKASEFTVLEDGKQQKIWGFNSYTESPRQAPATAIQLPPNQFTNITTTQSFDRPITIVLLDMLNTAGADQAYARQQMIEFLRRLPPGERVALFVLGTQLRTVLGFNGDSETLVRAATALLSKASPHLITEGDRVDAAATVDALTTGLDPKSAEAVRDTLERAISEEETQLGEARIKATLSAINALTRSVGGYPGRKTLLWLSADFPLRLGPDFAPHGLEHFMRDHTTQVKQTQSMLADSQMAVYPIDIRGLTTIGFAPSASGISPANMSRESIEQYDSHQAMNDIAKETGGEAYYNMNDVRSAMLKTVADETKYYTLAYVPENHDWDGKYRKIEVKANTKNLHLSYRRGYFALEKKEMSDDDSFQMFDSALKPYMPAYTMLMMKVQVLPPDTGHKFVRIDYAVDAHNVSFNDPGDQHQHAVLDFMAMAWDTNNQEAGHIGKTVRAALPTKSYAQIMQTGIPLHQELELKPGTYRLRLGVIDRGSQRIGTVDVPLTIPN